jgi:outer membrane protein
MITLPLISESNGEVIAVNKNIIYAIIGCILFFAWTTAQAADHLTLEDSIRVAVENNPEIKAQNQEVMSKDMEKSVQFSRMLPSVNLKYGYERTQIPQFFDVQPFGKITTGSKDVSDLNVEARQILFAGGALYNRYKIAKNDYYVADLDRQTFIRDLKLKVIDAYYGVILARQVKDVAQSDLSSVKSHLDVANAFFNQGMIPKNDLLEAQVRYAQSEQNLISAKNAVKLSESNYNLLLSRDLSSNVSIENEIPFASLNPSLEESTKTAQENRQEIKIVKTQIENAEKGVNIAKSAFLPSVAATAGFERMSGDDIDINYHTWRYGIGMNWNLFESGGSYWNLSKTQITTAKIGYQLQSLKDQISLEVKNYYLTAEDARARMKVAESAIAQAEEYSRIVKDRYNLQVATTTDVLDAQTMLDQAKRNYISARSDYARALAALNSAMGIL